MNEEPQAGGVPAVSGECLERLAVWVKSHPQGLDDPETLPGLAAIVAEECELQLRSRCWRWLRTLGECKQ